MRKTTRTSTRNCRYLSVVALSSMLACGGGDSSGPTPSVPVVTPPAASLNVASGTVAIGGSIPRRAYLGLQLIAQASWKSSNAAVATVSADGIVTGVTAGTTTIEATSGEHKGSAEITVADLRFKDLVLGGRSACAQTEAGDWYCWGGNWGRLSGSEEICQAQRSACSSTPRIPMGLPIFTKMSIAGGGQTCGLNPQGRILCWGRNDNHFFFSGPNETCEVYSGADDVPNLQLVCSHSPVLVTSQIAFADVAAGGVGCGITASGEAHCWGDGGPAGQLGVPATSTCDGLPCVPSPGPAIPNLNFKQLSVGQGTTCGVTQDGAGYCIGSNLSLQRGADVPDGMTPNLISGGHSFQNVSNFRDHTCGVSVEGDGYCWGLNSVGQLGTPASEFPASSTPQLIPGGLKFTSITPGLVFTCGRAVDGQAYCWGDNSNGQLGDGTTINRSTPAPVAGGYHFAQVKSGRHHTCGLTVDGHVYCWGGNTFGELGYGDAGTALFGSYFSARPVGVGGLP